jgi:hypothetical protein
LAMRDRVARFAALFVVIVDAPRGLHDAGLTLPSPSPGNRRH